MSAPRLPGTRIPAAFIGSLVAEGLTADEIRAFYPSVTDGHFQALAALVATPGDQSGTGPTRQTLSDLHGNLERAAGIDPA